MKHRQRTWTLLWSHAALVLLVGLTACRPKRAGALFDPADPAASVAALTAYLREHPDDAAARRDLAHIHLLHLGQTGLAIPMLDQLARSGDPVARTSRLLIADGREHVEQGQAQALGLLSALSKLPRDDTPTRRYLLGVAPFAARYLSGAHGERTGDDDRFVAFYDQLDLSKLPALARQPLTSLRASIARRLDEPYRKYYRDQGCIQDWEVGALLGTHGSLELERHASSAFVPDPKAQPVKLACVVRVWNPTIHAGVRRLRSVLQVSGSAIDLDLSAETDARFMLDGELIYATDDTDRFPARRYRVRVPVKPGEHTLDVAMTVAEERAWLLARVTEVDGTPIVARAGAAAQPAGSNGPATLRRSDFSDPSSVGLDPKIYGPLLATLALEAALADGDSDEAEVFAGRIDDDLRFPSGHLVRAQFERADPTRGTTASAAREQASLKRALALDDKLDAAQLRLLEIMLGRGDDAEALETLAGLPQARLRQLSGELLRFRAHRARGNDHLAMAALERATKINPESCSVLIASRSIARELGDVNKEDELAQRLGRCAGTLKLRANVASERGRHNLSEKLWLEALKRTPDDVEAIESLARVAATTGNIEAAQDQLKSILELNPYRVGAHIGLADLAAAQGDLSAARSHIEAAVRKLPHSGQLREAARNLGVPGELDALRVDGRDALESYLNSGKTYEGVGEVLILDRSVTRLYENGGMRTIVHLVVHMLSKAVLDRYGEMEIPAGARLLSMRTIKPDGTTLEPERVPGKEGVSLRDLEIGDVLEYEFVVEQGPSTTIPGYVDVSTFRFQSLDVPYHRSELIVVHPPKLALRVDRRNDPPQGIQGKITLGGEKLVTRTWRADQVARLGVEPGHRALIEELPNVRVYTDLKIEDYLRTLAAGIRYSGRSNPELRRLANRLVQGKDTPSERLRALWSWVVENIEPAGDLRSAATSTLAARTGNRLILLRALLREAGIRSEMWLARDAFGPQPLDNGHPMVEAFGEPMLAVWLGKSQPPTMVVTGSKVQPIGYLSPGFRRSKALRLRLGPTDGPPGVVTMPSGPVQLPDRRSYDLDIKLDRAGAGVVSGTITLEGMEAIFWRQALRELDRDRIREVFGQAELAWLRGATVEDLTIEHEKELTKPLLLRFRATAQEIAIIQGRNLVLRSALLSLNPGARYTSLARRTTGLVVPYAPEQDAVISINLADAKFSDIPPTEEIKSDFGTFRREVSEGGVGQSKVVIRYHSQLRLGVVEPSEYESMAGFTRKIDSSEKSVLRARL